MSYPAYADLLFPAGSFNSLGFVLHREQWYAHFRDHWMVDDCCNVGPSGAAISGWDWAISHHLLRTPDLWVIQPAAARSVHTGRENGEYCTALFHDLAFADLPLGRDGTGAAQLVDGKAACRRARRRANRHVMPASSSVDVNLSPVTHFVAGPLLRLRVRRQ
jgi:hypothetical protein